MNGTFTIDRSYEGLSSPRELFFLFVEENQSPFPFIILPALSLNHGELRNHNKKNTKGRKRNTMARKGKVNGIKGFEKNRNITNQQIK